MVNARTPVHRLGAVLLLAALVAALALLPANPADAARAPSRLYACVTTNFKTLNLSTRQARCPRGQSKISWSTEGARGARGARGLQGVAGSAGAAGAAGAKGDTGARGEKGDAGAAGAKGETGARGERGESGSPDTPAQVLAKLLEVDGPESGLDADLFGGLGADAFQKRVTGTCATGSAIRAIAADGTASCQSTGVVAPLTLTEDGTEDVPLTVRQTNAASAKRALDVSHAGPGAGIFAASQLGSGIQAATGHISSAAVIGDSSSGEAIVARQDGEVCDRNAGFCTGIGAMVGRHDGRGGIGVRGFATAPSGGTGVLGQAGISGGTGAGVRGENLNAANGGNAVEGVTLGDGAGVFGQGPTLAGLFNGNVRIDGDLTVTGTTNGFSIDDPRAPATHTLRHTPVQTDELTVSYSGNVTTDADGLATVELPGYAITLGTDWRYQLTPIGRFGQVIVQSEVNQNGSFTIRSEHGDTKVSWAVTGVRHDPQATSEPFDAEQPKTAALHGRYAEPSLYGAPATRTLTPLAAPTTERPELASER